MAVGLRRRILALAVPGAVVVLAAGCGPSMSIAEARAFVAEQADSHVLEVVGDAATVEDRTAQDTVGCGLTGKNPDERIILRPQADVDLLALLEADWRDLGTVEHDPPGSIQVAAPDVRLRANDDTAEDGTVHVVVTGPCFGVGVDE